MFNQTSFVDVSVIETTTTFSPRTSIPSLESTATVTMISDTVTEGEDSVSSTNPPSMFSTSMAPPRPTTAGQEEELITTVAPTIKDEHENDVTATSEFNIHDFVSENITSVDISSQRGDSLSEPTVSTDEPDDHSVIEISTIQPDVQMPDFSLSTEPLFAEGKMEETILESGITTAMTSDLTDTPTDSTELTQEDALSSSESPSVTTPFPDYDSEEIETKIGVEVMPPTQPPEPDISTSPPGSTTVADTTTLLTDTTFMCNTRPSSEKEMTTTETATPPATVDTSEVVTAAVLQIEGETSAEDVTSLTAVHIFDESTTQVTEHSRDRLTEEETQAEIGTEFFTSSSTVSSVDSMVASLAAVVPYEPSIQMPTVGQIHNMSGKSYPQYVLLNADYTNLSQQGILLLLKYAIIIWPKKEPRG